MVISKRDRKKTAPEIREELNHSRPNDPISVTTIKDRLNTYGLRGRIAAKKPLLRVVNKLKRLNWAKKYIQQEIQ